jgi:hypothetical protein
MGSKCPNHASDPLRISADSDVFAADKENVGSVVFAPVFGRRQMCDLIHIDVMNADLYKSHS